MLGICLFVTFILSKKVIEFYFLKFHERLHLIFESINNITERKRSINNDFFSNRGIHGSPELLSSDFVT